MGGSPARIVSNIIKPKAPPASPTPAPTVSEVSQSTATGMDGFDSRKTKRKGRSATILTGPMGVEEQSLTLGTKSLLGQ